MTGFAQLQIETNSQTYPIPLPSQPELCDRSREMAVLRSLRRLRWIFYKYDTGVAA